MLFCFYIFCNVHHTLAHVQQIQNKFYRLYRLYTHDRFDLLILNKSLQVLRRLSLLPFDTHRQLFIFFLVIYFFLKNYDTALFLFCHIFFFPQVVVLDTFFNRNKTNLIIQDFGICCLLLHQLIRAFVYNFKACHLHHH